MNQKEQEQFTLKEILDIEIYQKLSENQISYVNYINKGKDLATLHLNGFFRVWDSKIFKLKFELYTTLQQTFSFIETAKYIIFHTKLCLQFFEKIDDYYYQKSEICIQKERVNSLYYDEKLETLLVNYYYSNEISLLCLRTFKELQHYRLKKTSQSICLAPFRPLFFASDFSGQVYKFSYLNFEPLRTKRLVNSNNLMIQNLNSTNLVMLDEEQTTQFILIVCQRRLIILSKVEFKVQLQQLCVTRMYIVVLTKDREILVLDKMANQITQITDTHSKTVLELMVFDDQILMRTYHGILQLYH